MAIFHSVYTGGAPFFGIWQKPHSACPKKEDSGMDLGTAQELYIYIILYNPETVTSMGIQPVNQKQYQILTSASVLPEFSKIYFKHVGLLLNLPHNVCIVRFTAFFFKRPPSQCQGSYSCCWSSWLGDPWHQILRCPDWWSSKRWSLDLETAIPPMDWTWYKNVQNLVILQISSPNYKLSTLVNLYFLVLSQQFKFPIKCTYQGIHLSQPWNAGRWHPIDN